MASGSGPLNEGGVAPGIAGEEPGRRISEAEELLAGDPTGGRLSSVSSTFPDWGADGEVIEPVDGLVVGGFKGAKTGTSGGASLPDSMMGGRSGADDCDCA